MGLPQTLLASKNGSGRRLTLHFLFRPWPMPSASTRESHGWICREARLVMTSRPRGDGTQGSAEHRWDRTGGVSFWINVQVVCWHRKSWFKLLVRNPSIISYFKFGIQLCLSMYIGGMPSGKNDLGFRFSTIYPRVIHESAWSFACHLFQALADALCINQTIARLDLQDNEIGDQGMKVWWVERCGASQGSSVKSGWIRTEICRASMEVMGSHRIWSERFLLNLFIPFQGLIGFWTLCLSTWVRHCSGAWKG